MAERSTEDGRRYRRRSGSRPAARTEAASAPEGGYRSRWTRIMRSAGDVAAERISAPMAGATTAAWAAALSFLTVGAILVFSWILGAGSGEINDIFAMTGTIWLACHLIPISIPDGAISALPIGLLVIPGWHLWRAGRWATRRSGACRWSELRVMVGAGAGVYASIALLASSLTATETTSVSPLFAVIGTGLVALVFFGAGASREAHLWPSITDRVSSVYRARLRGAGVALLVVLSAAALLLGISLAVHFTTSMTIMGVLSPGFVGNILLFVLSLLYLPNLLTWSMSFVMGAGFAVGTDTVVSPFGVDVGQLPALPTLAAVPESYHQWYLLVLLVPLAAGGLASWAAYRAQPPQLLTSAGAIERAWVPAIAAAAMFVASWLAMGSLGTNEMAVFGTNPLFVALSTFVLLYVGSFLGDALRWTSLRRRGGTVRVTRSSRTVDVRARRRSRSQQRI